MYIIIIYCLFLIILLDAIVPIKPVDIFPNLLNPAAPIDCKILIKFS